MVPFGYRRAMQLRKPTQLNDLPPAMLHEIFVRLPVKNILRLTAVCTLHKELVNSTDFKKFHHFKISLEQGHEHVLVRNKIGRLERGFSVYSASTFAYAENSGLPRRIDIPLLFSPPIWLSDGFAVYGSCNGLLCLSLHCASLEFPIFIYNPSIGRYRGLPKSDLKLPEGITAEVTLGFGYNPKGNDYQVVRLVHPQKSNFYAEVYTLELNSWRELENVVDPKVAGAFFLKGCACVDGVVYWILLHTWDDAVSLVCFDMSTSVLSRRELAINLNQIRHPVSMSLQVLHPECLRGLANRESKKSLCLCQVTQGDGLQYCEIWDLKGNAEQRIARIRVPNHAYVAWPLGFSSNGSAAYIIIDGEINGLCFLTQYAYSQLGFQNDAHIADIAPRNWFVDSYRESLVLLNEPGYEYEELI